MKKQGWLIKTNSIDMFSPYFFLPFILLLYFFTSLFDFHRFEYFDLKESIIPPLLVGLISYYGAVYLADKKSWTLPSFGLSFLKGKTTIFLYILGIIGLTAYLIMLFTGQVGITDESVRRNLDPKLNFLSSFLWFSAIFLLCNHFLRQTEVTTKKKLVYGCLLFVVFGLFILMGYRTPIVIMFFTVIIVFHYGIKRFKLSWLLTTLFIIGLALSMFGFYRTITEDPTKEFNSHKGPDVELKEEEIEENKALKDKMNETPKWIRAINNESVMGHVVLSKLMEYTEKHGYLKGELHASIFSTVLPGEQLSSRTMVTKMVNSLTIEDGRYVTRPGRTTVPTFLGQLYIEAGYVAIVIGFALYGFILSMMYNQMKYTKFRSYQTVGYAFVTTIFAISMHTGLLDLVYILMIGYAIVSVSIEKNKIAQKI
jgi:hypothetical protein